MVVKFPTSEIYHNFNQGEPEFLLSQLYGHAIFGEDAVDQKVTFSLKFGKKRKMIPGRLKTRVEYSGDVRWGYYLKYYFVPNNRTKFLEIMNNV